MAYKRALMGTGHSAAQADSISGPGTQGLVATGTNQATALLISWHVNAFVTVASSTGAVLSSIFTPGDDIYVYNGGSNTLAVYPNSTDTIDNTTSVSIPTKKGCYLKMGALGAWTSHIST